MFEIHPVAEDKASALATQMGVDPAACAMVVWNDGEEAGGIVYRLANDTIELLGIQCAIPELQEWLVRAALNAGANRNAITAVCADPSLFELLCSLGFERTADRVEVFIPAFFNRPCAGGCGH